MNKNTSTDSSAKSIWTSTVSYSADAELIRAIQAVRRKAAKWKRECCGKKAGRRHCEGYGCASLTELLEPLSKFKLAMKARNAR